MSHTHEIINLEKRNRIKKNISNFFILFVSLAIPYQLYNLYSKEKNNVVGDLSIKKDKNGNIITINGDKY
jgi:hypothetical protein